MQLGCGDGAELLVERYTPHRVSLLARPRFSEVFAASQYFSVDGENISDWVELYNPEAETVDLSGMVLSNKKMDGTVPGNYFVFPESTQLEPGAYLVIACSEDGFRSRIFQPHARWHALSLDSAAAGAVWSIRSPMVSVKDYSISRVTISGRSGSFLCRLRVSS
jgi:hypothetical protein